MDCLEFRRLLLQDPYRAEPELLQHESDCAECAHYAARIRQQEASLRRLLNAPAPPPELAENIRLGARMERRSGYVRRVWLSAAASLLIGISISMFMLFDQQHARGNMLLARSVIHHIEDEAGHLREPGPASPDRVRAVLARFGAELVGDIGPVRFAAECVMHKRTGVHLVLSGEQGPVTAFMMPGEHADSPIPIDSTRFHGEIIPTEWGVLAVVGERGEVIAPIATRLARSVHWPQGGRLSAQTPLAARLARLGIHSPQTL